MVKKFVKNGGKNRSDGGMQKGMFYLYGKHAVKAAVANEKRIINKILVTEDVANEIKNAVDEANRKESIVQVVDKKEFENILPAEAVHQGVVALVKESENYLIEDVVEESDDNGFILILDQVTDPQNVGAIVRSCAAFGAKALVMQDKNSPLECGSMAKAAAGTLEMLPVCRVTNLSRTIEYLKKNGYWIVGMDGYAKITIDKMNKNGKIAIVMGSEGKGMRRLVEESCDETVKLLINPKVESLNVSTAAAIALYEISCK